MNVFSCTIDQQSQQNGWVDSNSLEAFSMQPRTPDEPMSMEPSSRQPALTAAVMQRSMPTSSAAPSNIAACRVEDLAQLASQERHVGQATSARSRTHGRWEELYQQSRLAHEGLLPRPTTLPPPGSHSFAAIKVCALPICLCPRVGRTCVHT